jgi:hypothetical protein
MGHGLFASSSGFYDNSFSFVAPESHDHSANKDCQWIHGDWCPVSDFDDGSGDEPKFHKSAGNLIIMSLHDDGCDAEWIRDFCLIEIQTALS